MNLLPALWTFASDGAIASIGTLLVLAIWLAWPARRSKALPDGETSER
jgi:hypothetical protein